MTAEWTEGVCDDGAAILRDGVMMPITDLLATLNRYENALSEIELRTRPYERDPEWPLVSAIHAYTRMALGRIPQ